jgi:hypothetical protein
MGLGTRWVRCGLRASLSAAFQPSTRTILRFALTSAVAWSARAQPLRQRTRRLRGLFHVARRVLRHRRRGGVELARDAAVVGPQRRRLLGEPLWPARPRRVAALAGQGGGRRDGSGGGAATRQRRCARHAVGRARAAARRRGRRTAARSRRCRARAALQVAAPQVCGRAGRVLGRVLRLPRPPPRSRRGCGGRHEWSGGGRSRDGPLAADVRARRQERPRPVRRVRRRAARARARRDRGALPDRRRRGADPIRGGRHPQRRGPRRPRGPAHPGARARCFLAGRHPGLPRRGAPPAVCRRARLWQPAVGARGGGGDRARPRAQRRGGARGAACGGLAVAGSVWRRRRRQRGSGGGPRGERQAGPCAVRVVGPVVRAGAAGVVPGERGC